VSPDQHIVRADDAAVGFKVMSNLGIFDINRLIERQNLDRREDCINLLLEAFRAGLASAKLKLAADHNAGADSMSAHIDNLLCRGAVGMTDKRRNDVRVEQIRSSHR